MAPKIRSQKTKPKPILLSPIPQPWPHIAQLLEEPTRLPQNGVSPGLNQLEPVFSLGNDSEILVELDVEALPVVTGRPSTS
jgi:hypothetical protein